MKKISTLLISMLLFFTMIFSACGGAEKMVKKVYINEENRIIVEYSDGSVQDFGLAPINPGDVKSVSSAYIDKNSHIIIEYSDGSVQDFGSISVKPEPTKSVVKVFVDENKHVIVEYSDNTTEDLGYVGVEVVPPLYTVTFVDINGNVLKVQEVYKGQSATAPEAPSVADKVFSGWDQEFADVQSDMVIKPTYGNMATYVVTFKDEQGNVISTQEVVSGRSATAPTPPKREDTIFESWDKSYSNITEDTTITAIYRKKRNCTVTFKDYSGIVLGTANVKEGDAVTAPITPIREGYTFSGWSQSLSYITSNVTVEAQYKLVSDNNIFDISYKVSGTTITVTLSLAGNVCLAGFEGEMSFTGMTVVKAEAKSSNAIANVKEGKVSLAYTSATNVTKGETVVVITLTALSETGVVSLDIADCFNQNFETVEYKVIGQNLQLK